MPDFLDFLHIPAEWDILAIIGVLIALTFLGSKIFQRFGIPQVVGFIVIGVLLGESFLNLVPLDLIDNLDFISELALGLIGFEIGSHLHFSELKKYFRSIFWILIFQSVGTSILVGGAIYLLTQNLTLSLLLGAIASATAPAATVDVLAEYDTKGPLTTILLAVVGLDDAMALLLFSFAAGLAESFFVGATAPTLIEFLQLPLVEIGGSLVLGIVAGLLLEAIFRRMRSTHDAMAVSIAFVFVCVGISKSLEFSMILTSMVLGLVIVNRDPEHGRHIRYTIEQAGPVIYVLFFALVGARLQVDLIPTMGLVGLTFMVVRIIGKYGGSWLGGVVGKASPIVRNYLGLGLLSQAGVAIGLTLAAVSRFAEYGPEGVAMGEMLLGAVIPTTFVVQLFGPVLVKFAVGRAGEIGKAREEDAWATEGTPVTQG
jgi:Kef-type K+ transport system membrane component KefB